MWSHGWVDAVLVIALMAGIGIVYCYPPSTYSFYPKCLFFTWTGFLCPGCGGFRAVDHLVHGRPFSAIQSNALAMLLLPWIATRLAWLRLRNQKSMQPWSLNIAWQWEYAIAAIIIVFWLVRNLPFWPCTYLIPPS